MTQAECAALEGPTKSDVSDDTFAASQGIAGEKSPAIFAIPAASLAVAACGGGGADGNSNTSIFAPTVQVAKPATDAEAARFILKASLAATEAEIADMWPGSISRWTFRLAKQVSPGFHRAVMIR